MYFWVKHLSGMAFARPFSRLYGECAVLAQARSRRCRFSPGSDQTLSCWRRRAAGSAQRRAAPAARCFNHAAAEGAPAPLPLLCQDHREPGMVDVLNRLCTFPGARENPQYGPNV